MKISLKLVVLIICLCYVTGCASLVFGSHQSIVQIYPKTLFANVEIIDTKKNVLIYNGPAPYIATLNTYSGAYSGASYTIKITAEGYKEHVVKLDSSLSWWYFGNIIFSGPIGMLIVDPISGGMWSIDDTPIRTTLYPETAEYRKYTTKAEEAAMLEKEYIKYIK